MRKLPNAAVVRSLLHSTAILTLVGCELDEAQVAAVGDGIAAAREGREAPLEERMERIAEKRAPVISASVADLGFIAKVFTRRETDDGFIAPAATDRGADGGSIPAYPAGSGATGGGKAADAGQVPGTAVESPQAPTVGQSPQAPAAPAAPRLGCAEAKYSVNADGRITIQFVDAAPASTSPTLEFAIRPDSLGRTLGSVQRSSSHAVTYHAPTYLAQEAEIGITATAGELGESATCLVRIVPSQGLALSDDKVTRGLVGNLYDLERHQVNGRPFPHAGWGHQRLPDFSRLMPIGRIVIPNFDVPNRHFTAGFPGVSDRFEWFGIRFEGEIHIARSGTTRFRLGSDDGSRLWIDDDGDGIDRHDEVIDNDGTHSYRTVTGEISLAAGWYPIRVDYYQGPRTQIGLELFWADIDGRWTKVPPDVFRRPPGSTPPAVAQSCNNGVGNGSEGCTPGAARPNDEHEGAAPGNPARHAAVAR